MNGNYIWRMKGGLLTDSQCFELKFWLELKLRHEIKERPELNLRLQLKEGFWFGGILGSASGAEFPLVSLSNHVGFTPRLLCSSTHHSPESFTHLKTG